MMIQNPVTCPFCAMHCDDLRLRVSGGRLELISPACTWAKAGIQTDRSFPVQRSSKIEIAYELIKSASSLLVVMAPDVTNETVEAALNLAQKRSASITTVRNSAGWAQAVGMSGCLTATLGDINVLEGTVIFCGVPKEEIPPRFREKINKSGNKKIIHIASNELVETIRWLRILRGGEVSAVPHRVIALSKTIFTLQNGVIVLGGCLLERGEQLLTEILLWLDELNQKGCWYGLVLTPGGNGQGISETMLRLSGYPGSIKMQPDGAAYRPRELAVLSPEACHEADLLLWIGETEHISKEAIKSLRQIPNVVLSYRRPDWKTMNWIQTARSGIETMGSMHRMDGVPVQLQQLIESNLPCAQEVLDNFTWGTAS